MLATQHAQVGCKAAFVVELGRPGLELRSVSRVPSPLLLVSSAGPTLPSPRKAGTVSTQTPPALNDRPGLPEEHTQLWRGGRDLSQQTPQPAFLSTRFSGLSSG